VAVIDTTLTPELLAEGDARELTRAIQDLRRQAGLSLDARITLWLEAPEGALAALGPHLVTVASDTLVAELRHDPAPDGVPVLAVSLDAGTATVALAEAPDGA